MGAENPQRGEFLSVDQVFESARELAAQLGAAECNTYHLLLISTHNPTFQLGMNQANIDLEDLVLSHEHLFGSEQNEVEDNVIAVGLDAEARVVWQVYSLNKERTAFDLGLELINAEHRTWRSVAVWEGAKNRVWEEKQHSRFGFFRRKK